MSQFLALPRELRDLIYTAILTWSAPRPPINDPTTDTRGIANRYQGRSPDEARCIYSPKGVPSTCANVLAVSRQVNDEMTQAITRARKKDLLRAKIDVQARFGGSHAVTWLSLPLVYASDIRANTRPTRDLLSNVPVVGRLLAAPLSGKPTPTRTTRIEQLQVDIRPFGHEEAEAWKWGGASQLTAWSVCESLRSILEQYPAGPQGRMYSNELSIDILILNVVLPPPDPSPDPSLSAALKPAVDDYTRILTRDLINVWNALWANSDARAKRYRVLLERIERVRVCVDGEVVRERGLRCELERGQRELRRIAERVGW